MAQAGQHARLCSVCCSAALSSLSRPSHVIACELTFQNPAFCPCCMDLLHCTIGVHKQQGVRNSRRPV